MIIRTDKRVRFLIFVVLVAAALALVVASWPAPKPATAPAKPVQSAAAVTTVAQPSQPASFFVTARLDQQQAQSRELALDQQVAADATATQSVRANAEAQVVSLARQETQEEEIRALLLAKGYKDALVYLTSQPAAAEVVLEASNLTEADVVRAADAVERVAGIPAGDISVMAHR